MREEKKTILKLLEEHKISAEEAERLLGALKDEKPEETRETNGMADAIVGIGKSIGVFADSLKQEGREASRKSGDHSALEEAAAGLAEVQDKVGADALQDLVKNHALSASISATGSAWVTGAGATIATTISVGFVWSMIWRLNRKLDIKLEKAEAKQVANLILRSVAPKASALYVAATGFSFIPVLGNVASDVIMTPVCYSATFTSGIVYLKALKRLLADNTREGLSVKKLEQAAAEVMQSEDLDALMKEARSDYDREKQKGTRQPPVDVVEDGPADPPADGGQ